MAAYCQVYGVIHFTCGLTACTPGSAPGPTLGNEYGKLYLFYAFGEATSQNLWSLYDRHVAGITWHDVGLKREDLSSCSHKTESVSLGKCPCDHWLTNKAYLSAFTVTSLFRTFTHKMAA